MSQRAIIHRYSLIISKIYSSNKRFDYYPSFKEIKDFLFAHGFEDSDRTYHRDISTLKNEFNIDIVYNKERNGYSIINPTTNSNNTFIKFLEMANISDIIEESFINKKNWLQYISFENTGIQKGFELFKPILKAISENNTISFLHQKFTDSTEGKYSINPYLLKEYQNRWYVIGKRVDNNEFRTFGLDRIEQLNIESTTFVKDISDNEIDRLFEHNIGLIYSYNSIENVVLSFTPFYGKYVKTLAWHKSQKVLIDDKNELRIELKLIPNIELIKKILEQGNNIKVIKPKWLVDEVINQLTNTIEQYK